VKLELVPLKLTWCINFIVTAGRVLMMLGKAQFELQKFVDTYVSYLCYYVEFAYCTIIWRH
jgi:hypothetical protein